CRSSSQGIGPPGKAQRPSNGGRVRRTNGSHNVVAFSSWPPYRPAYSPHVEIRSPERGSATLPSTGGCRANATVDTATAGGMKRRSVALAAEKFTSCFLFAWTYPAVNYLMSK